MHINAKKWLSVFGLCLILACLAHPATAQDGTQDGAAADAEEVTPSEAAPRLVNGTQFGAWRLRCDAVAVNETVCVLNQNLIQRDQNRFLAELVLFPGGENDDNAYLAARVPVGVYFPSGFVVRRDEEDDRLELVWQACDRERCEALIALSAEELEKTDSAEQTVVGYRPAVNAQPLVFQVTMTGAKAGIEALRAAR